jgi:hypothetical protein
MSDLGFVLSLAVPVPRSIQFIRFFISVRGGSMRETCGYLFFSLPRLDMVSRCQILVLLFSLCCPCLDLFGFFASLFPFLIAGPRSLFFDAFVTDLFCLRFIPGKYTFFSLHITSGFCSFSLGQ